MNDLYRVDLSAVNWINTCGGNQGTGQAESCALVAAIPGRDGSYAIADTKRSGVDLRFTTEELIGLRAELNGMDLAA